MNRAAVLIGVRQAGSLPRLEAVWDGVEQMEDWARDQGLPDDCVTVLTDQQSPVSATDILQAVKQYVERRTFDQLIVYFSGHGLNVGYTEYWLLSKFPDDGTTAVNVATSIEIARSSIIPHVVFISDACRTAADAVHTQAALNGALSIFPNVSGSGQFRFVDAFYATVLGRPALEVRAPNDPAGAFQGIYTEAMVDALRGRPPIIPEPHPPLGKAVIRPWPLKRHLDLEVPQRMLRVNPRRPPSQQPDAVISSDPAWLNALDRRDVVALYPLDRLHFGVTPEIENKTDVDNHTPNRHGIDGYLDDAEVARRIHDALVAS